MEVLWPDLYFSAEEVFLLLEPSWHDGCWLVLGRGCAGRAGKDQCWALAEIGRGARLRRPTLRACGLSPARARREAAVRHLEEGHKEVLWRTMT